MLVLTGLALALAALALGERSQSANLIASLDGGISPLALPRHRSAPAAIHLFGQLRSVDGSALPRVRRVELAVAGRGSLDARGLPVCRYRELSAATPTGASRRCRASEVGRGALDAAVLIAGQRPFRFHASLRAFNGRDPHGHRLVWLHVYGPQPPLTLVIGFRVHRRPGAFGTALVANLGSDLGPWPRLARFHITLHRRFAYRGQRRSYISSDCPLPPRFSAGFFSLARATYTLADGRRVSTTIVRGCRVRTDSEGG